MKKLILLSSVLVFLLSSCTEKLDLDLNDQENKKLVVDAFIDDNPTPDTVYLSYTSNYFDVNKVETEDNAQVSVTFDGVSYNFNKVAGKPGYYSSPQNFLPQVGFEYTLDIVTAEGEYQSKEFMFEMTSIDSIGYRVDEFPFFDEPIISSFISFQDDPGVDNFYLFRDNINGDFYPDTLIDENLSGWGVVYNDDFLDGQYAEQIPYGTHLAEPGDTLEIIAYSISKRIHDCIEAIQSEADFKGGLFDSPGSNAPSNISGDNVVGLFIVGAEERNSVVLNFTK